MLSYVNLVNLLLLLSASPSVHSYNHQLEPTVRPLNCPICHTCNIRDFSLCSDARFFDIRCLGPLELPPCPRNNSVISSSTTLGLSSTLPVVTNFIPTISPETGFNIIPIVPTVVPVSSSTTAITISATGITTSRDEIISSSLFETPVQSNSALPVPTAPVIPVIPVIPIIRRPKLAKRVGELLTVVDQVLRGPPTEEAED
ncbi:hypothetical protein BKA69DRAFT_1120671 [Paraphysoderma sedebokerense]|nr:hypothetical protein BKA69DRAFT_1120671 [Paraphysoderma sedebokerense]